MTKYKKNFKLFDRNNDNLLIYDELKEFMISIGQMIPEGDLKEFYKELMTKTESAEGPVEGIQFESTSAPMQKSSRSSSRK
jgi:Ca2+-binding EF-hand superfamily protein